MSRPKTLKERIDCGEVRVVEQGRENTQSHGFRVEGEYRILSDGRKQWRQLGHGGRVSRWWDWQDC